METSLNVLVVEDEPLLRMNAVDILENAGFTVSEAGNSWEALQILRTVPDLHILFTDMQMPGEMDGLALAHLATKEFPAVAVVIVSGHRQLGADEMPPGATFIPKPYEPQSVVFHLHERRRAA